MQDFADRWGFGPDKFWLRGERKKEAVAFDEENGVWHLYGHPESAEVLMDTENFTPDGTKLFEVDEETAKYFEGDLAQMNGPEHVHLRKQVIRVFNPKFMDDLERRIVELCDELIGRLGGRTRFNLLTDFVDDLSGIVFAELLGIPADDRTMFRMVDVNMDQAAMMTTVEGEDYFQKLTVPLQPLRDMLGRHIDDRADNPREDLISLLCRVKKLDGSSMTRDQIINFVIGILGAGHLATPLLIGNTMLCLESFPEQYERVRADRSLVPTMLDETMRFLSPGNATYRATLADVEVAGQKIPKDQMIRVELGSANRDPRAFRDPDSFDVSRSPNPHLGFGRGAHHCIGAQMIKVETRVVFDLLMDRFPVLRVDPEVPPVYFDSPDFTGVKSVAVRTG
ncbi:cytochrome P450 [Sphaerisporangium aureirubrum]|uniref:Cytochrome P450 n=1 Tax=Sphaerisporangium aureirubrum TaxID=1544736 RepID=A0ABW1NR24_9ACTN